MKRFDLQEYLRDLAQLCAIDSGHGYAPGTNAMADFFEARFGQLGLKTERRYCDGNTHAPMVLARNSRDPEIDVLFIAHMDTVFAPGTAEQWPFTVDENGIGHGPGCVDCKGGCLSLYYLLREMLQDGECKFRFCVALNSDEEKGSRYSYACFQELAATAKYCFVFEPGRANDEFVGCRKAGCNYLFKCHGVPAHAGVDPEKGASAILELSRWVNEIYTLVDYPGGTALNVGRFTGGGENGIVPDYAECNLNYRYLNPEAEGKLKALLHRMQTEPFDPRTSMEVVELNCRPGMFPHAATEEMFVTLREVGAELGQPVELLTTGGASDGNWVSCFGVATLDGCGPCGGNLHTRNEYLKTQSVEPRLDIMRRLLNRLYP